VEQLHITKSPKSLLGSIQLCAIQGTKGQSAIAPARTGSSPL
jgi:hypothetical protein